ncbi:hypothetical protein B566_EDAN007160 [Ephemera danica]|nr:hypothetical protein B566_EDAN007160 [Ephemera danica]
MESRFVCAVSIKFVLLSASYVLCLPVVDPQVEYQQQCNRFQVLYNGSCETLLQQGPCGSNEWLIIDDDGVTNCALRACAEVARGVRADRTALMGNECVTEFDIEPCPTGMEVKLTPDGRAECDCKREHVYWFNSSINEGSCYQPFYRGPCTEGQMLYMPPLREGEGRSKCRESRCRDGAVELQILANHTIIVMEPNTAECFPLLTACKTILHDDQSDNSQELTLDSTTWELKCMLPIQRGIANRNSLSGRCSYGTMKQTKGQCQSAGAWLIAG